MSARGHVTVVGAYGHTGRFVVAELRRRGWTPILAGRDDTALRLLAEQYPDSEVRSCQIDDPRSLDRALGDARAVINAAGPFGESAPAVIDSALRARVPYLDVTGEPFVARELFERYGEPARQAGVVVMPAVGFFGGLGDLLATAVMGDWPDADEITVAVALDSWHTTRGTRAAAARRAGRRLVRADGRWHDRADDVPRPSATWVFPAPVGAQTVAGEFSTVDVVTIGRHLAVPDITTFLHLEEPMDLTDVAGPRPVEPDGRSAQTFLVDVTVRRADALRRGVARGQDIYAITAPIVVEVMERVLDDGAVGGRTPGEILDSADVLRALPLDQLTVGS